MDAMPPGTGVVGQHYYWLKYLSWVTPRRGGDGGADAYHAIRSDPRDSTLFATASSAPRRSADEKIRASVTLQRPPSTTSAPLAAFW